MGDFLHALILQPLFNLLISIYSVLPGHDFGLAIILMTIIIRLLLWPLLRKQIHQQKAMKELRPEIKKIKKKSKGDRQKEAMLMQELYKEREINPLASVGVLLIQLPILATLFIMLRNLLGAEGDAVVQEFTRNSYQFVQNQPFIQSIIADPKNFTTNLLGLLELHNSNVLLAVTAGLAQYFQSKQLRPDTSDAKSLRDILGDAKEGKDVKMGEQNAAIMNTSTKFFPVITFFFALNLPAALALYWTVSNGLGALQYKLALQEEVEQLDPELKEKKPKTKGRKNGK